MNLRQAAEQALEMFDWLERRSMYQDLQMKEVHEALRRALAHEWVDLTDEDIQEIFDKWDGGNLWDGWNYEYAIAAKVKEKNT